MESPVRTPFTSIVTVAAIFLGGVALAQNTGSAYKDPEWGWSYVYNGDTATAGTGSAFDALDGTWSHDNGSDAWDGSGLGGTLGAANRPGGVTVMTEWNTTFLRIQDCGDPRDHTYTADPSNRKIMFGHDLASEQMSGYFLEYGVTISFRARVATTGLLDAQYPDAASNGENRAVAGGTPWPAAGNGYLGHDGGKGNFVVRQMEGDSTISFSLVTAADQLSTLAPYGQAGLVMNGLNGATPDADVDPWENEGDRNLLPMPSVTDDWHEFWIVIQSDMTYVGTHQVDVYVDGSLTPETFVVTAGDGDDYEALNYIAMGCGGTQQQGAIDIDFFAITEGIYVPELADAKVPVAIAQGPKDVTVAEGGIAEFSVVATGGPPRLFQWQRSAGGGSFTNIPNADASFLSVGPVGVPDNGAQFRCTVYNSLNSLNSDPATLNVDSDKESPTIVRSFGKHTLTNAFVEFSEPVTAATANVAANYKADKGLIIRDAILDLNGTKVTLVTSQQTSGETYTLSVSGIRDTSFKQNLIAADSPTSFPAWVITRGFLTGERFLGIPGTTILDLTSNPKYPDWADQFIYANSGDVPQSAPNLEDFGGRLIGWLVPPETGDYVFHLRGDDDTELRLSTTPSMADLDPIIQVFESAGMPYQPSWPISLVKGQRYAIEALWKEGPVADFMQVAWTPPSSTETNLLPTCVLEGYADPMGASMTVTAGPDDQTGTQSLPLTLTVTTTFTPADSLTSYIWERQVGAEWKAVACGTPSYTIPRLQYPGDNGAKFRAIAAVPGAAATSRVATVTVVRDTVAPAVVSATRYVCSSDVVTVVFDEVLDEASAALPENYEIKNLATGASISVVSPLTLSSHGRTVRLTTAAALADKTLYQLILKGLKDLAGNAATGAAKLIDLRGGLLVAGPQNLVAFEAENYDLMVPCDWLGVERSWLFGDTLAGYSGTGYVRALPDEIGEDRPGGNESTSIDYCVWFPESGTYPRTYYVWVRGSADDGADNSVHAGLDGAVPASGVNIQENMTAGAFVWLDQLSGGSRAMLDVPNDGMHTVHIYMREDGFYADKILLTTDSAYNPVGVNGGLGPTESPRQDLNPPMPGFVDGTASVAGGKFSVQVQTMAGLPNVIQYKNTLTEKNWSVLTTFTGDGGLRTITDPSPLSGARFYRMLVQVNQ